MRHTHRFPPPRGMTRRHGGARGAWPGGSFGCALALALALLALPTTAGAVDPTANQEQLGQGGPVVQQQLQQKVEKPRPWFFDALFETHWMVVRDNEYSNDVYHTLYLRANYDVPRLGPLPALGRFSLRVDVNRMYVADQEESGFLLGDLRLYYSRGFSFAVAGQEFGGRGYFYWTFPTSKISDQEGNIARPTAIVALSKELPYNFTVYLRPFARLNWARYAETRGGTLNQKWILGYDLQAIYTFHLHKPLSLGVTWGQDWYDRYESRDGFSQPWNSEYYWEVFAGYALFAQPVVLDLYLALASGRATMEDGVWRFKWTDRDETEAYLSISARY